MSLLNVIRCLSESLRVSSHSRLLVLLLNERPDVLRTHPSFDEVLDDYVGCGALNLNGGIHNDFVYFRPEITCRFYVNW